MAIARVLGPSRSSRASDEDAIGFEVKTAETGEEALERMAEWVPDILLLDLKLPGISGLDVLRRDAGAPLPTLTVMITAYATLETAIEATKQGAHDFLPKPFTPDELRVAVRRVVTHLLVQRQAQRLARGEAPGPLPVHLGARPRAQGAAGGDRRLPADPEGRFGGHRPGRHRPGRRAGAGPRGRHAQA